MVRLRNPIGAILLKLSTPVYWMDGPEGRVEFAWLADALQAANEGATRRPADFWSVIQTRRGRPYRAEFSHDPGRPPPPPDSSVREPRHPRPAPRSGAIALDPPE